MFFLGVRSSLYTEPKKTKNLKYLLPYYPKTFFPKNLVFQPWNNVRNEYPQALIRTVTYRLYMTKKC